MDSRQIRENVLEAQRDENVLNEFIEKWEPFILDVASGVAERRITKMDEEWTVAWSSFYEAIKRYTEERGDFKHYAEILVRKRVLDYTMFLEQNRADISKARKKMNKERKTGFYSPESEYEAPMKRHTIVKDEEPEYDDDDYEEPYDEDYSDDYDDEPISRKKSTRAKSERRKNRERKKRIKKKVLLAALITVILGISAVAAMFMPYTTYHVESDASVAYTTNILGRVIDEKAGNKEGKMVISAVDAYNKNIDVVLDKTITEMIKQDFVSEDEDDPINLYATGRGKKKANDDLEGLELRINKEWKDMLEKAHRERIEEEKKKQKEKEEKEKREQEEREKRERTEKKNQEDKNQNGYGDDGSSGGNQPSNNTTNNNSTTQPENTTDGSTSDSGGGQTISGN